MEIDERKSTLYNYSLENSTLNQVYSDKSMTGLPCCRLFYSCHSETLQFLTPALLRQQKVTIAVMAKKIVLSFDEYLAFKNTQPLKYAFRASLSERVNNATQTKDLVCYIIFFIIRKWDSKGLQLCSILASVSALAPQPCNPTLS